MNTNKYENFDRKQVLLFRESYLLTLFRPNFPPTHRRGAHRKYFSTISLFLKSKFWLKLTCVFNWAVKSNKIRKS